jgi:hypothetical protein
MLVANYPCQLAKKVSETGAKNGFFAAVSTSSLGAPM